MGTGTGIVDEVRQGCARVARLARHVRIEADQIPLYAASLPDPVRTPTPLETDPAQRELIASFWLTMDAINFGSGWFPTLKKRPGRTGYATISERLRRRLDRHGQWSAAELTEVTQPEMARVLGQDPEHELMGLFAGSLRDLGHRLRDGYGGSYLGPIEQAAGSAVALVETLAGWDCFSDSSTYDGETVVFLKRAQIAAADLHRAGAMRCHDLGRLTMFADNLVPHVLRLDGILTFEPELVARIDREELIEHGSAEEVEIRACAVHAVELIVQSSPGPVTAAAVDQLLWHRGQGRHYKASPRHRSRSTAY